MSKFKDCAISNFGFSFNWFFQDLVTWKAKISILHNKKWFRHKFQFSATIFRYREQWDQSYGENVSESCKEINLFNLFLPEKIPHIVHTHTYNAILSVFCCGKFVSFALKMYFLCVFSTIYLHCTWTKSQSNLILSKIRSMARVEFHNKIG